MTLREFLEKNREQILERSWEKTESIAGIRSTSPQLKIGLPLFYEQLLTVLDQKLRSKPNEDMLVAAAAHGRELLALGYSLSHVVHAYGAMCQAITEVATEEDAKISSSEFNILNGCLDVAIASAVSEYQFKSNEISEMREIKHLGFLAHELRNSLSSATVAHDMIKAGMVGTGGSTAAVLEANLKGMRILIDRSLSEVRLRSGSEAFVEKFRLSDLFDQITLTAETDAKNKKQVITSICDPKIEIEGDRQYILSAVANLLQNAIKYTKAGGKIFLSGKSFGDKVFIEIEDECGGINVQKIDSLFEPFVRGSVDQSGLGLGLSIVQRAINSNNGKVTVKNTPGKGCTFTVELPLVLLPDLSDRNIVRGKDAIQPDLTKKIKVVSSR